MKLTYENIFLGAVISKNDEKLIVYKINQKTFYAGKIDYDVFHNRYKMSKKGTTFKDFAATNKAGPFSYEGFEITEEEVNNIQRYFNLKTSQDLFLKFYEGSYDTTDLKKYVDSKSAIKTFLQKFRKSSPTAFEETPTTDLDLIVFGKDEEKLNYSFAKCCTVIPGDKIFGFITISDGIKVHNDSCPNAINLRANYDYRVMPAKWVNEQRYSSRVRIEIEGIDRKGLVNDITEVISNAMSIDMRSISIESHNGIFLGTITLEVKNKSQLEETLKQLKGVFSVTTVKRM